MSICIRALFDKDMHNWPTQGDASRPNAAGAFLFPLGFHGVCCGNACRPIQPWLCLHHVDPGNKFFRSIRQRADSPLFNHRAILPALADGKAAAASARCKRQPGKSPAPAAHNRSSETTQRQGAPLVRKRDNPCNCGIGEGGDIPWATGCNEAR